MSSRDFGLIQIFSTQATRDKLVFHVGSDSFNLGAGTLGSNNTITWVNSGLSWTAADTVSLSIAANTAPDAPTNLTATPGDGRLTLSWDTPADGGSAITGYEDRRSADGGTNWSPDWTALALSGAATTSFTVTGLANGTAYTFEVRAVNAVGKGTAASATATPVSPTAPLTMPPPGALVSNYAQTEDATRGTAGPTGTEQHALAQSIRLASSAQAQTLGSVVLSVAGAVPTATLTVSLHAQGSSNQPGTKLADLTGAAGVTDGNNTFTAPANTELMSDTGYWFVVQATGAQVALRTTASNSEDAGSATGWSIGDRSRKRSQDADSWSSSDSSLLLAVYGSATPAPAPTVTDVDITSTPAADDNYQTGETIQVTVTFDKAVTVDDTNGTPRIELWIRLGQTRWADFASGSGMTALVFEYEVAAGDESKSDGIGYDPNVLELNGGTIRDDAGNDAVLDHGSGDLDSSQRVNYALPAFVEAETSTDGTQVILTFDEALRDNRSLLRDFAVKADGTAVPMTVLDNAVVSGRTMTLKLNTAVTAGQTVTVSYTRRSDGDGNIEDLARNKAESFTDQPVTNRVGTDAPDLVASAETDGLYDILVTFGSAIEHGALPSREAFRATMDGREITAVQLTPVCGDRRCGPGEAYTTLRVTIARPFFRGETVTLDYRRSEARDPLTTTGGAEQPAFVGRAVENRSTWTGKPTLTVEHVPGSERATEADDFAWYRVRAHGAGRIWTDGPPEGGVEVDFKYEWAGGGSNPSLSTTQLARMMPRPTGTATGTGTGGWTFGRAPPTGVR